MRDREAVFRSLYDAHTKSWNQAPTGRGHHMFFEWRMKWWDKVITEFPEYFDGSSFKFVKRSMLDVKTPRSPR